MIIENIESPEQRLAQKGFEVLTYRSHYFINMRNTSVQRWAAKLSRGKEYYTMNKVLYRAATGQAAPSSSNYIAGSGHTMYFKDRDDAISVAQLFINGLTEKEVI